MYVHFWMFSWARGLTEDPRLQFVVWLIPSFITGAIAVSLIGMFLGPMYPVAISYTPLILPRSLVNGAIGWITAVGATGSALLPFLTGQIANKYGIGVMQPLYVPRISGFCAH